MPTHKKLRENCAFERDLVAAGYRRVAGVDEVGRGALFGPVVAAAVVLGSNRHRGIDDSKRLSPSRRHDIALWIMKTVSYGVASATVDEIDTRNIRQATLEAMRRAIRLLDPPPDFVLVDGEPIPGLPLPQQGIVRGDQQSMSIAAASILAKVQRDALMSLYEARFPWYNLATNKGYGTRAHVEALRKHGMSSCHRRSFCRFVDDRQLRLCF